MFGIAPFRARRRFRANGTARGGTASVHAPTQRAMTDYSKWDKMAAEQEEDDDEKARRKLRDLKNDMSDKEVRRLHECWEKPEFRGMFHEYAEEVSDPAHRVESEKYLAQCEAEQRAERDAKQGILHGRSSPEICEGGQ